ncbi:serine hydrolase [Conexibacter stalactiti]|uniref:Serine hydrolase n=1 Tax=Conexibacter stalactiti TaxID=1940611 RepID=A0ABU4HRU8_9ACTN|nr:serine hydrolase [Conexibacter stalactiti]MDW5595469.1 serine hydrolase [Conexibacter stalactiti]MEC5036111.1 serine hydrolase [Conexibacter stalactiti]
MSGSSERVRAAEQARRAFERAGATGHLHVVDVDRGVDGVELEAGAPVAMASVFKLPLLVALFQQADAGALDLRERLTVTGDGAGLTGISQMHDPVEMSLRDLALAMMSVSDCTAADALYDRVGQPAVQEGLRRLGLASTTVEGCCRDMFAAIEQGTAAPAQTTPRDMTRLLSAIWTDAAASPEACATMRRLLQLQVWPHRLASGFPSDDVTVGGKTGTLPGIRNEVGVVEYPDGTRYAAAVFTVTADAPATLPEVDASIGTAARICIDALRA